LDSWLREQRLQAFKRSFGGTSRECSKLLELTDLRTTVQTRPHALGVAGERPWRGTKTRRTFLGVHPHRAAAHLAIVHAAALILAPASARADVAPANIAPPNIAPPENRLETGYVQYGAALSAEFLASSGAICPEGMSVPCVIGSGGGVGVRGGYRFHAPFYLGVAYEFSKHDAHKSIYLAILQQVRAETRYFLPVPGAYRPFLTTGLGAVGYGSQWGLDTVGGMALIGFGLEIEFTGSSLMSLILSYRPILLTNWRDSALLDRPTGVLSLVGLEVGFEQRVPTYEPPGQ
jgi:hypothetical protein